MGANCTLTSGDMIALAKDLRAATTLPLLVQPNAGRPDIDGEGGLQYAQSADEFAADMAEVAAAGVAFLGGCCGTTPETIRRLKARLRT